MKMKKKTYWQRRSEDRLLDLLSSADSVVLELGRYYDKASKDIDKSIRSLYGRFMSDNDLDKNKALELIKGKEFRDWRMTMEEYLSQIKATDDKALLLELNTLAMRSRINRLEALQAEIMANCAIIASKEEKVIGSFLSDSIEDTYYKNVYDEYKDENPEALELMNKHKVAISRNQVKKVLELPWSGANYSQNIWNNSYFIAKRAQSMVAKNIIAGRSIENLSRDFAKVYGKQYYSNVKRLLRTETAYVKGQADVLTYEKLKVEEYELLATLDNRTSSICQEKDGKHYPVDEIQVGINYPPFHPNCRTTTMKYREDYGDRTRIAKDKDGKNVKVPLGMKYDEWKKWVENPEKGYNKDIEEITELNKLKNSGIEEKDYKEYLNIINNHENKSIRKLYSNYADKIAGVKFTKSTLPAYSPKENSLTFNFYNGTKYPGISKYSTLSHEYGHFFDEKAKFTGLHFKEMKEVRNATGLNKTFSDVASSSDEFLEAIRKDKKHIKSIYTLKNKQDLIVHDASHGAQDAIDGLFPKSRVNWGHGEKYYNQRYAFVESMDRMFGGSTMKKALQNVYKSLGLDASNQLKVKIICRQYEAASEAWANIMSAEINGGEELEYIKKYLPNSYEAMIEILKEVSDE